MLPKTIISQVIADYLFGLRPNYLVTSFLTSETPQVFSFGRRVRQGLNDSEHAHYHTGEGHTLEVSRAMGVPLQDSGLYVAGAAVRK